MNVDGKGSPDLSTATKLKDVVFSFEGSPQWNNTAIETIKSKDPRQVTVKSWHVSVDYREWGDLDRLLDQLWTSRSIPPKVSFSRRGKMLGLVPKLLPELTKRGLLMFSSVMTDGRSEDGSHYIEWSLRAAPAFKCRVALCFVVASCVLALLADACNVQRGSTRRPILCSII